jgi:hypothetical protein
MGKRDFHFFVVPVSAWAAVLKIEVRSQNSGVKNCVRTS